MTKKRIYTSDEVETIILLRKTTKKSIRSIAEIMNIPKSVVGRWIKDPNKWKEKYRFNIPKYAKMSKKKRDALKRFEKKVAKAKKKDPDKYGGLLIHYPEDEDYEVYSG